MKAHGKGSPKQVAQPLRQGAAALTAAHWAGVIHRDIKPGNIFMEQGEGNGLDVKILDFGLAKTIRMESTLTQAGVILGTPAYMSPEQMLGRALTPQSDLYSFAAVVFEALTGVRLVGADEFAELASEVLYGKPPAVSTFCKEMPHEVNEAFYRALSKNPKDRPQSVEEWAGSFAQILETVPYEGSGWPENLGDSGQWSSVPASDATKRIQKRRH
jgi:serine/threonine protein kinase